MPRLVMDGLLRKITRDIASNYPVGKKYLTIQQIAGRFHASSQTAQRAIKILEERGMVKARPRSGITVTAHEISRPIEGKKIAVVSRNGNRAINFSYLKGIRQAAEPHGITVEATDIPQNMNPSGIQFGEFLASLDADGIIGISLYFSFLPIYHAVREGLDVVTDLAMPELPGIATVQLDSYLHASRAGEIFKKKGYTDVLVIGATDLSKPPMRGAITERYSGLKTGFGEETGRRIFYVNISEPGRVEEIDTFFQDFTSASAVYSLQSGTNWLAGTKFLEFGIKVKNDNFIVNNDLEGDFRLKGLPPVKAISPGMQEQGLALGKKLVGKWQTGEYSQPLAEKI